MRRATTSILSPPSRQWRRFVALCLALVGSSPAFAQQRLTVASRAACADCSIELRRVVTLGDREGPGGVGPSQVLARDSRGRYFHVHRGSVEQILVFDAGGRFLRTVGRRGEGPGEFRGISRIAVGRGDTLYIFDSAIRRLTVLSPTLAVVRTQPIPMSVSPTSAVVRDGGGFIASADVRSPDRAGYPLHDIDSAGHIERSFGAVRPEVRPGVAYQMHRSLASAGRSKVWAARKNHYVVELWDAAGGLERVLERDASWFRPWLLDSPVTPDHAPAPRLQAIDVDSAGRLWVLTMVADPRYREALTRQPGREGFVYTFTDEERVFDTIIEVIDPRSGRLLASRRIPQVLHNFVSSGLVFSSREDAEGYPFLDVWQVRVAGR